MMKTYLLLALLGWNLLVFIAYAVDKRRARQHQWRIPEKSLLLMTLALGGLGAFGAGKLYRHKTKKWYFVVSWYLGSALVFWALYWMWQQ